MNTTRSALPLLTLLASLILLSTSGCATQPARVVNHGSDLEVFRAGVKILTKRREPAGDYKRMEDAPTYGDAYNTGLDLEEAHFLSEADKAAIMQFTNESVDAMKRSREPECSWWDLACRRRRNAP